jgi:hypothetical protein
VKGPSVSTYEVVSYPTDTRTQENTKISNVNMMTQVNNKKIKFEIENIQHMKVLYCHPKHRSHRMKESMYKCPKLPNQSQCFTYINFFLKINTT